MDHLLNNLNTEQLAAVTLPAQSALILAGAGSGKTRVLTTRIAWLLKTGQVSSYSILAVTFTNKAAKEMLARLGTMLSDNLRGMWVGTFHGLCNRILRLHWKDAALPQSFNILDAQDQLSAVKRILKVANLSGDWYKPQSVAHYINSQKEKGLRAGDVRPRDHHEQELARIYEIYESQCQREGVVDFAELLLRCCELLERNQPLREHYQSRFRHILVDEFQDTNDMQYRWLKLLAGKDTAIFAVGDDDQSIYAFRGANVENMLAFRTDFKVKNFICLEQNYRSKGNILDAANALIAHNQKRLGKNLRTDAGQGEPVRILKLPSDTNEADWVCQEVQHLKAEGIPYREMAVLYRSNAQSRVLEHSFINKKIPYRVYGGLRFFERAEIKHAIAYLQLISNPNNNAAFMRVANFPPRGIGTRTLEQLDDLAKANNCSLYDAIPLMNGRSRSALEAFARIIDQGTASTFNKNLPDLITSIIESSGLEMYYQKEKEGAERLENLEQLISAAAQFLIEEGYDFEQYAQTSSLSVNTNASNDVIASSPNIIDANDNHPVNMSPLSAFLSHASLEAGDAQADENTDAVQLMTVHAAKGLEFEAVFITGLEEGLFPHENSSHDKKGLEEERRLMYVALTRAKKKLYLSCAEYRMLYGHANYNKHSSFIDELPEENTKLMFKQKKASYIDEAEWGNIPSSKPQTSATHHKWRAGQSVYHKKFGEGVIIRLESGDRAFVNFGSVGMKHLDLTIAKLERL